MKKLKTALFAITLSCAFPVMAASAAVPFSQRSDVHIYIDSLSKQYGFKETQLDACFNTVQIQPAIIVSITKPYEKKPWDIYQKNFLQNERIQNGVAFFTKHRVALEAAEKKYGVPAPIIVAILGVETYYGTTQGKYRVLDALSTLGFDYPPRASFFRKELTEFLLLCRQLNLDPTTVQGSYAGAIGQPQFMPSSYRHYAIDVSGEGLSDLRSNPHDAIFSVANYLKENGWRVDEPIATPAKISGNAYKQLNSEAKRPLYTMEQLKVNGVVPMYYPPMIPEKPVGLVKLDTTGAPQYWIGFNNFYTIMRYNTSSQYAMAVFLLAAEIQRGMGIS